MTVYEWMFWVILYIIVVSYTIHFAREINRKIKP